MTTERRTKMAVEKCYLADNRSYTNPQKSVPVGIVVHSTGANNPFLKRWVQPSKSDPDYDRLIKKIGVNQYSNSWNRPEVNKSTHFMIGKFADGTIGVVQTLPTDICCWACGSGKKGSYNYPPTAHIQFEVCEDSLKDQQYFYAVYKEAVNLCAELCEQFKWDPDIIVSHSGAYKLGYASNHADIDHWLKIYGITMKDFRNDVLKSMEPYIEYTVVRGDNLTKIAKKYKTTISRIVDLNSIKYKSLLTDRNFILIGWVLRLDRI